MPFPVLENAGLRLRRGQLSLWVAAPGVGKSQLLQNIAIRSGEPTCYWSGDTDVSDVLLRTAAMLSARPTWDIEQKLHDPLWHDRILGLVKAKAGHVEWVFDSEIRVKGVEREMKKFAELHGSYPHLLVIDNLTNAVQSGGEQEHVEIRHILTTAKKIGRSTNAHVAVLHHATGEFEDGDKPIPQRGAQQKSFKIPETGVTMYHPDGDRDALALNFVKQRGAVSDPGARFPVILPIDFSCATVLGAAA